MQVKQATKGISVVKPTRFTNSRYRTHEKNNALAFQKTIAMQVGELMFSRFSQDRNSEIGYFQAS